MIPHRIVHSAMMIILVCALLLSMSPAIAGAIGTTTTVKPRSRTVVIEAPRDGEGREGRERQGMSIPLFMSGMILGGLLGLLGYRVVRGWQGRQARQRDIDRLTEQFQALFRER